MEHKETLDINGILRYKSKPINSQFNHNFYGVFFLKNFTHKTLTAQRNGGESERVSEWGGDGEAIALIDVVRLCFNTQ